MASKMVDRRFSKDVSWYRVLARNGCSVHVSEWARLDAARREASSLRGMTGEPMSIEVTADGGETSSLFETVCPRSECDGCELAHCNQ